MPLLTDYECTYSAPPEPIGSTTGDIDFDESEPYLIDYNDNDPSDTEIL
jgi:hypothetical protein